MLGHSWKIGETVDAIVTCINYYFGCFGYVAFAGVALVPYGWVKDVLGERDVRKNIGFTKR